MSEPDPQPGPDEIERARLSQRGAVVLEVTGAHVARRRKSIEKRVYQEIRKGTLSPENALAAWHEMNALHTFEADLRAMAEGRNPKG